MRRSLQGSGRTYADPIATVNSFTDVGGEAGPEIVTDVRFYLFSHLVYRLGTMA